MFQAQSLALSKDWGGFYGLFKCFFQAFGIGSFVGEGGVGKFNFSVENSIVFVKMRGIIVTFIMHKVFYNNFSFL